jgi:excisionase family DNA binding protein
MSSEMSTTEPALLTLQEAADVVGCHYQTLYRRVRSGEVPALVAGGTYRISREDLEEWLQQRSATAGAVPQRGVRDWSQQSEALSVVLLAGDSPGARKQIDRLLGGGATIAELCDNLFAPVLFQIGERWHAGELSIADEHRASRMIESLLERAVSTRQKPGPRVGSVVVATAIGDHHALAAQRVAAGLQAEGFTVHYLGADLPVEEIVRMATRESADLVALSCCVQEHEGLAAALAALGAAGFPTLVGGNGIGSAEASQLGATRYGGSIGAAQLLARDLVGR